METTWSVPTKRLVAVGIVLLLVAAAIIARPVLPTLVLAGLIAFILAPLIRNSQERLHMPKAIAILFAYLFFFTLLLLVPLIFVPALVTSFASLELDLTQIIADGAIWVTNLLEEWRTIELFGVTLSLGPIVDPALDALKESSFANLIPSLSEIVAALPTTLQVTASVFGVLLTLLASISLTFIISVYMLVDGGRVGRAVASYIPEAYRPELRVLAQRIQSTWNAFLRGQLTLALVIWLMIWIGGTIIGLPGAFALAVLAGVLEIIPNLGPVIAAIPAVIVALVQGSTTFDVSHLTFALVVIGLYIVVQQVENQLLVPRILGSAVELPSVVILVAVLVGFQFAGILGALLAAPTAATLRELIAYALNKILDREPFPPSLAPPEPTPLARLFADLRARLLASSSRTTADEPDHVQEEL
jgi:predicted PurR-regulated permease PerM